jgi:MSHA biogenesis protein MshK
MIAARHGVIAVALAMVPGWGPCFAQQLSDPMRPPAFAAPAGAAGGEQTSIDALVLQSTLLSNGRRIAMIDGKPMKVGDQIGKARIMAIDPGTVTLREANKIRVLQLYPGAQVTSSGPSKAEESRKGAKEGPK